MPQERFVHTHRFCDGNRECSDALAVAFRLGVFRVQRSTQSFERIVVRLLEILQRNRKLLRALGDQMLQIALIDAVFNHQSPVFQRPPDAQIQLIFFKWLENVIVRPCTDRFESDGYVVHCRHHDHWNVGVVHAELGEKLEPVHFRHDDIAQHQIERIVPESVKRNAAVSAGDAVITLRFKKSRHDLSNCFFIVYDQNLFFIH